MRYPSLRARGPKAGPPAGGAVLVCLLVVTACPASVKPIDRTGVGGSLGGAFGRSDASPTGSGGSGGSAGTGGSAGAAGQPGGGTAGRAGAAADARRMDTAAPPPAPPRPPDARPADVGSGAGGGGGAQPKTILFVTGSMGMILSDTTMVERLTNARYQVTIRTDTAVRAADTQGKGAIILSGSTSQPNIAMSLPDAPTLRVPILAMDENLEPFLNLTANDDADHGTTNGTQVEVLDNANRMLTAGLDNAVTIFTVQFNISWGVPGPGAVRVATVAGQDDQTALFAYPAGAAMANGAMAPAKRGFFFVRDSPTPNLMTEDALKLFDAMVAFLTTP
jgi:hypothetical protein